MNKKTSIVLRNVVRELFEDGAPDPILDVPGEELKAPGQTVDPTATKELTPTTPSMSPVYAQPQGLAMSPDYRTPDYSTPDYVAMRQAIDAHNPAANGYDPALGRLNYADGRQMSPDHRTPDYSTPDYAAMRRAIDAHNYQNGMDPALGTAAQTRANIDAHKPTARGYDPALGNIQFYPEGMPPISPDHRVPDYFDHNINTLANDVRQLGQGVAHNNAAAFNNSINSVANTARQAGQDIAFNNSINSVANNVKNTGQTLAHNAMLDRIAAHKYQNGMDPALGTAAQTRANIDAHNPKTGYDPALGPVINAANGVKDAVGGLAQPQPWYQGGLNWMKNNKLATAGILGVPAVLAGAHLLNKRRNRNQQNG